MKNKNIINQDRPYMVDTWDHAGDRKNQTTDKLRANSRRRKRTKTTRAWRPEHL